MPKHTLELVRGSSKFSQTFGTADEADRIKRHLEEQGWKVESKETTEEVKKTIDLCDKQA